MSITDIVAGRMAPAQTYDLRYMEPAPPASQRGPSPFWQPVRRYWRQFQDFPAWLPGLLQESSQSLARLPTFLWRHLKARAPTLRRREARPHKDSVRGMLRSEASATLLRLLAYAGTVGVLGFTAAAFVRAAQVGVQAAPSPVIEWRQVAKPFAAFSLPLPELAESGYDYAMRRHASGGGRQDVLTWGALKGATPHLMVEIYRPLAEHSGFGSAEEEIAARLTGIDAGAVTSAGSMETKFGAMSLVEFSLSAPPRQCLGFVHAYADPQLQILGWHCTSGATAVERNLLACALDRLTLLAAGSEPKLRALFAHAELRRKFCGQRSHLLTPTPRLGPSVAPPELRSAGSTIARRAFAKSPAGGLLR
jgi:hypothetical protein